MLDITKPVQTRNGTAVTLVATNLRGGILAVGYIGIGTELFHWNRAGRNINQVIDDNSLDLVNVPEVQRIFLVIDNFGGGWVCQQERVPSLLRSSLGKAYELRFAPHLEAPTIRRYFPS